MDLLIAWVAFPLLLVVVSGGLGLAVERVAGVPIAGVLIVPVGLAALVAVSQLTAYWSATAPVTTPLVVLAALAGLIAGRSRLRRPSLDPAALLAALGVFIVLGAPVLLSGGATFAGYTVLGDSAIQFMLIDRLMEHGHTLSGLATSSYRDALGAYFDAGYPLGSQVALGAVRPLVGQDVAWVYQPYLGFLAVNLSLSLYALTARLIPARWSRALVAFFAAQPALVVGYALQGSIKELATAWIVVLLVVLVRPLLEERHPPGAVVPLAIAAAAGIAAIGPAVAPWLVPVAIAGLLVVIRTRTTWRFVWVQAGVFAGIVLVLSIPTIAVLKSYSNGAGSVITATNEVGNLLGRLDPMQVFGIWIAGDYRVPPSDTFAGVAALTLTHVLIGIAIASAAVGLAWAARRRAVLPLLYVGVSVLACAYVAHVGSPWAEGKAFMIVSPAVVLSMLLGPAALLVSAPHGGRFAAGLLALAIGGGILASNGLAYHDVSLAPRDRLEELARIGAQQAGRGPTLYTEFEEFGKHFLRAADPTGVSEAYSPGIAGAARPGGSGVRFGYPVDLDALDLAYVLQYRTIVLRRSPIASRPPSDFRLVSAGRWYEVWRRDDRSPRPIEHVPLGTGLAPSAPPRCSDVGRLARRASAVHGARLAYVVRSDPDSFVPAAAPRRPAAWVVDPNEPNTLDVTGSGVISGTIAVRSAGPATIWLGGSFARSVAVDLDGRLVARFGNELSGRGQFVAAQRSVVLSPGVHRVQIVRGGGSLAPGNGNGASRRIGPVLITPTSDASARVRYAAPRAWRSLCGRQLDWIETV